MKVEKIKKEVKFTPVELKIVIELKEEFNMLYDFFNNVSGVQFVEILKKHDCYYDNGDYIATDMLNKLYNALAS